MTRRKLGHGGARPGAGQPPVAGQPQTERINLRLTESERAEIEAAVPTGAPVGRWIVEAAVMRAREVRPDKASRLGGVDGIKDARLGRSCDPTGGFIARAELGESDRGAYMDGYRAGYETGLA